MSIRLQLLCIALTTLILPWAGCQYARELESTLRVSREMSLQAAAGTIAHALAAQPQTVLRDVEDTQPFAAEFGDFYVYDLHNQPLLDGYREDWDLAAEPAPLPTATALTARMLAGYADRFLFLYVEVDDSTVDPEPSDVHPDRDRFDRVDLTFQLPDGALQSYFFATAAQGLLEAQTVVGAEDGSERVVPEPRIQAYWRQTSHGYHLEARIPLSLVGLRLWVEARDGTGNAKAGFMGADTLRGGRMFSLTPGLNRILATFIGPDTRATVIDSSSLELGRAGSMTTSANADPAATDTAWYRRWLRSTPEPEAPLKAAAPLVIDGQPRGAVLLEQPGDQLVDLRDRALRHLFNLTLLATALSVSIAFGIAGWISMRIGRLRSAVDGAVGADGSIRLEMPESARRDEIGALSRGFERLLGRLNEHTHYLRTLGGKLSHELRTPLTIVRSSLDNLESEGVRADQRGYVTRAREGISRLQAILSALGAASRVEESIKHAERVNFDLRALLQSAVAAYRDGFRRTRIELDTPADACFMRGAPDLIVQMLDKLIENAVDFCPLSGAINVRLARIQGNYELTVDNDGPGIPAAMLELLFESLFERRQGVDDKPHFGLGLYIVRLVAEFHGGAATAANRADGSGAVFTVVLPLI